MDRVQVEMEFIFRASPAILYKFLTMPDCLIRWFSDGVTIEDDIFTYTWNGYEEQAELLEDEEGEHLRFHWLDSEDEDEYFQFDITRSSVTGETILEITDFADEDEVEEQEAYWEKNMDKLKQACGG